jgi:predicted enzyme related to lactoylglutathione lyase
VALVQNPDLGYRPGSDGARLYLDAGDALDAWSERAVAAGGRMVVTARPTPAGDRVCVFEDVEGNLVGLRGR